MNQNQKNLWVEYLKDKNLTPDSIKLLRIVFCGEFFNDYPVYKRGIYTRYT